LTTVAHSTKKPTDFNPSSSACMPTHHSDHRVPIEPRPGALAARPPHLLLPPLAPSRPFKFQFIPPSIALQIYNTLLSLARARIHAALQCQCAPSACATVSVANKAFGMVSPTPCVADADAMPLAAPRRVNRHAAKGSFCCVPLREVHWRPLPTLLQTDGRFMRW